MCTNMRMIRNMYNGQELFVKCGRCKACQQEKANARAARIRNHCANHLVLFLTLTYSDEFLPYIKVDDVLNCVDGFLPIYRKTTVSTYCRNGSVKKYVRPGEVQLDEIKVDPKVIERCNIFNFKPVCIDHKNKKYDDSRISVCYYKDAINFVKKLRQNLKRRFQYYGKFQFFLCSEYGETTDRAHLHGVLFCDKSSDYQMWKSAVASSWSFDDCHRQSQCEVARNPASYVASYVNSNRGIPELLRQKQFMAKCSYSKGLGTENYYFQLDQVLEAIKSGDMRYPSTKLIDNVPTEVSLPLPSYVVHKYFPKFTGYGRLTFDEIFDIYSNPSRIHGYKRILRINTRQARSIETMLRNRLKLWISRQDRLGFAIYTYLAWQAKFTTSLRLNHEEITDVKDRYMAYDNIIQMLEQGLYSDVVAFNLPTDLIIDPNQYPDRVRKTNNLIDLYDNKDKTRRLNNFRDSHFSNV